MVFFSTKRVLSAFYNDYWENRTLLDKRNDRTKVHFYTLGMERSRVLDNEKYAD